MSRYDKYDPKVGGFRAALAADWVAGDINKLLGVGLNATGEVVVGGGTSGLVGVIVLTKARKAGEIVDVMTAGEVVEFGLTSGEPAATAGTVYYANTTTGVMSTTNTGVRVGHTVEADRLIVRFKSTGGAA